MLGKWIIECSQYKWAIISVKTNLMRKKFDFAKLFN